MVKKRDGGYKQILTPQAQEHLKNNACPACGLPKTQWKRRTSWTCCSTECTEKHWNENVISFDWKSLRLAVFRRDKFTCVKCGKKPTRKAFTNNNKEAWMNINEIGPGHELYLEDGLVIDCSVLIADHVHAIALGGEEWDMQNIQTLCLECNKTKTAEDAGKIAALRKWEKQEKKGQTTLT